MYLNKWYPLSLAVSGDSQIRYNVLFFILLINLKNNANGSATINTIIFKFYYANFFYIITNILLYSIKISIFTIILKLLISQKF